MKPVALMYGRIILYDAVADRASQLSRRLRDMGYLSDSAGSVPECMRMIAADDYWHLFIGRVEDNLTLFKVIKLARGRRMEVTYYDVLDGVDGAASAGKMLSTIENAIILSKHSNRG
jgi:hypothetical protein